MIRYIFAIIMIITIGIYDKTTKKIPNFLILIGFIAAIVFNFIIYPITLLDHIARVVIFIIIFMFGMKRWLGGGDIKMWLMLDLLIGPVYSSLSVCIASILLVIYANIKDFKSNLPSTVITFNEIKQRRSIKNLDITVFTKKGFPLGVFMVAPVTILCIISLLGAGFDLIK